ncbi:hypothetical protein MVEG_06922 [Podila verticillata NRRL 6337]|nr:hypothetical protein MVEG_06922 [Podila verticillata NRRL 6337]
MERRRQQAVTGGADPGVILRLFDSESAKARFNKSTPGQRAFASWMRNRERQIEDTTPMDLTNFLNFGLESKGWKPQTARTYLSAALKYFPMEQQKELRKDENLEDFLRVMGNNNLKCICHQDIDLEPIFSAIQDMGNNTTMTTKQLTTKTCFLLGLVGFLRPDDLACIDVAQSHM